MRVSLLPVVSSTLLATSAASAAPSDVVDRAPGPIDATPVIGGSDAPIGKWPDVTATIHPDGRQECTGTLIAPTVVLTAAHCIDEGGGGFPASPTSVVVGTSTLARRSEGDVLGVERRVAYPDGFDSYDVGVLVLAQPSRMAPRPIATGWAAFDIANGASVVIAGFGAVDRDSNTYVNELQEATTTITDHDCSRSLGCNAPAKPAGELGAGGMGIDTCPGDSGGPLYLTTTYGTFLAGVTSRAYDNNVYDCSEGGIYARPDKIIDWIESTAGVPVARGPVPTFEPMMAVRGTPVETTIVPNDPKGSAHTFAITTPPTYGTAVLREDGRLRICTDPNTVVEDYLVVTVTDRDNPTRALTTRVQFAIIDGEPGDDCDPQAFGDFDGGGCCSAGGDGASAAPLAVLVVIGCARRRRR